MTCGPLISVFAWFGAFWIIMLAVIGAETVIYP